MKLIKVKKKVSDFVWDPKKEILLLRKQVMNSIKNADKAFKVSESRESKIQTTNFKIWLQEIDNELAKIASRF